MRLLLINPNTSVHITERLAASARLALDDSDHLTAVTASDGPAFVSSAAELAIAEASALKLVDRHRPDHDAVLLGISLDGAAPRMRVQHPDLPVVGMTEAALFSACMHSQPIGLLTLGAAMLPLYRQRVEQIGLAAAVVAYEAPDLARAFEADSSDQAIADQLVPACRRLRAAGAKSVVLAGAVLCGLAAALAERCAIPVFDGVECAVGQIRVQLALRRRARSVKPSVAT